MILRSYESRGDDNKESPLKSPRTNLPGSLDEHESLAWS
jgi:hypothetical protein